MVRIKKLYIAMIITIIAALGIWSVVLDFSRFISLDYSYDVYPSAVLKRVNVILAALIAWSVGINGLSIIDSRRLKAALTFACIGDAFFILGERVLGVGMFSLCQALLIIRNSAGINFRNSPSMVIQKDELYITGVILIITFTPFMMLPVFLSEANTVLIAAYFYGLLLCLSLLAALRCNTMGLFPRKNSRMVAVGMICFFCCDVLVAFDAVLDRGLLWLLANSFIWVFYIPALVMLALSCYRYD